MAYENSRPTFPMGSQLRRLANALQEADSAETPADPYQNFTPQLTASFDLDTVLRLVLDHMARAARADRAFIALTDRQGALLRRFAWGIDGDPKRVFPHSRTLVDRVIAEGRSLRLSVSEQEPPGDVSASQADPDPWALAGVPLVIGGEAVGLVYLERRTFRAHFQRQDLDRLESLAAYATAAIHHERMDHENAVHLQKQRLINEVSLAINATLELDSLLSLILQRSLSLSGGEQGYILLGHSDDLTCLASLGSDGRPAEKLEISRSLVSRCLEEDRSICILDTHEDLTSRTDSVLALELRSVMCVRLAANQQRLGVLYISSRVITKTFTPEDQSLLEAIANQAALAIHHAQLLKEQERQISDLERTLKLLQEAQTKAITDGLTGLYNHAYFKEFMGKSVLKSERYGQPLSLIMVDLDHFKQINDTHGHPAGDEVLRRVADTVRRMVRDCDVLARYGGEELAILLPQTDLPGGSVLAERVRAAIANLAMTTTDGTPLSITASLGVATHRPGVSATQLLDHADKALYLAKHGGRNRVCTQDQVADLAHVQQGRSAQLNTFLNMVSALSALESAQDQYSQDRAAMTLELSRLLGEDVHMSSRILAVVDAYGALLTDRPDRCSLTTERAVEELKRSSGIQFDPAVIKAILQIIGPA